MRDPMAWALPVFRAFGVLVRVHLAFFVVALGLCGRTAYEAPHVAPGDIVLLAVGLLFLFVLLHEFGHCFGGRAVGGEADEILIWPLGGLAFVNLPRNWKAHAVTVAAGPLVNAVLCLVTAVAIAGAGFVPAMNPVYDPFTCAMHNHRSGDGRTYTSEYGLALYETGSTGAPKEFYRGKPAELNELAAKSSLERALAPAWVVWLNRAFWLNWLLLLVNLVPAFPLDGGQFLQAVVWGRTGDSRRGTTVACVSGYVCGALFLAAGIVVNEVLPAMLGLLVVGMSYQRLRQMEAEDSPFGDFSGGYTSLDQGDDAPPARPRPGPVRRWLTARAARRIQRDLEARQRDDERMDELLAKIARAGKASLTDEERRFMERVSERYRR